MESVANGEQLRTAALILAEYLEAGREMSAAIAALHAGDDLDFAAIEQWHAAAEEALTRLDPVALRAHAEAEDGYRVALDDALPALEWMMARSQLLSSMNQPTMGHDPRQDELITMDLRLRREFRPLKLLPILSTARAALAQAGGEA